jgi:hypothetical protein
MKKRIFYLKVFIVLLISSLFFPNIALGDTFATVCKWATISLVYPYIGIPAVLLCWGTYFVVKGPEAIALELLDFAVDLISGVASIAGIIVKWVLEKLSDIVATLIDVFINLNPFADGMPADILWKILVNIAYPLLVFATLFVAFQYILGRSGNSHRLLWYIVLVALLINFTFSFIKEAYGLAITLERSFLKNIQLEGVPVEGLNQLKEQLGFDPALFGSPLKFILFNRIPDKTKFIEFIKTEITKEYKSEKAEKSANLYTSLANLAYYVTIGFFYIFNFLILLAFLCIILGRLFFISIMTGVAPLALTTLAFPWLEKAGGQIGFRNWLNTTFRWLAFVPVTVLLTLIGISIQQQLMSGFANKGDMTALQQLGVFALNFFLIAAWSLITINIAFKAGGAFGSWGEKIGWGAVGLLGAGALAGGAALWRPVGRRVKRVGGLGLSGVGRRLKESRIGALRRAGLALEKRGEAWQQDFIENVVKKDIEVAKQLVETGKDPAALRKVFMKYAKSKDLAMQRIAADLVKDLRDEEVANLFDEKLEDLQKLTQNAILNNAIINRLRSLEYRHAENALRKLTRFGDESIKDSGVFGGWGIALNKSTFGLRDVWLNRWNREEAIRRLTIYLSKAPADVDLEEIRKFMYPTPEAEERVGGNTNKLITESLVKLLEIGQHRKFLDYAMSEKGSAFIKKNEEIIKGQASFINRHDTRKGAIRSALRQLGIDIPAPAPAPEGKKREGGMIERLSEWQKEQARKEAEMYEALARGELAKWQEERARKEEAERLARGEAPAGGQEESTTGGQEENYESIV